MIFFLGGGGDPSIVVFIQNKFFLNLKFYFGTVGKKIVKYDLKNEIKRNDASNIHSHVGNNIFKKCYFFPVTCNIPSPCGCVFISI